MTRHAALILGILASLLTTAAAQDKPATAPDTSLPPAEGAEQQARVELTLARIRLELVLARKAIDQGQLESAARRALRVQALLGRLPDDVDAGAEALQVEAILARARKAGVEVDALAALAAAPIAHADDAARPAVPASADLTRQKLRQQRLASDRVRVLTSADEAGIVPLAEITYPPDWPRRVASRARFRGGQIARSGSWIDDKGYERYVAIYDVHDLIYVPPDFQPPFSLVLPEALRNTLDRAALRDRSQIFGGYAEDLAAGIPLLRFFGGVDEYAFRGPAYSEQRLEQIVQMMQAFTQRSDESKMIVLPPAP